MENSYFKLSNASNEAKASSSSSTSSSNSSDDEDLNYDSFNVSDKTMTKKPRLEGFKASFPEGFLAPLPSYVTIDAKPLSLAFPSPDNLKHCSQVSSSDTQILRSCKQFWKAGDFDLDDNNNAANVADFASVGMDHARVHPKFLHSNATCHKWALGAFAELLDNSLDEVCNGATYVHMDMLQNKKTGTQMLLIEDDGRGMTPDKMRQCMSLGYSAKIKIANTIGQYGNGFKTSTMRLGADVIVYSRCQGKDGRSPTQSIGMLSYTFLKQTRKEDIVVPMIDYESRGHKRWNKIIRSSLDDWNRNLATLVRWSPYNSDAELLQEFKFVKEHGTRIIIYNLWEDDEGHMELDFAANPKDIQIRGINEDDKNIRMAKQFPNSRHFFTYRHSLRSYASILYLRLPPHFRIILRGEVVDHHNIVDDMMSIEEKTYKPVTQNLPEEMGRDSSLVAHVTMGFVKDASHHIDIQGFSVYHKNRLIKPFWRVWNAAGSDGRGVIGICEANFVEPAHDKQGFERTSALSKLEARLRDYQKEYWSKHCQEVGYAARRNCGHPTNKGSMASNKDKSSSCRNQSVHGSSNGSSKLKRSSEKRDRKSSPSPRGVCAGVGGSSNEASPCIESLQYIKSDKTTDSIHEYPSFKVAAIKEEPQVSSGCRESLIKSKAKNIVESGERLKHIDGLMENSLRDLDCERNKRKSLENELQQARQDCNQLDKDLTAVLNMLQDEREKHQMEEESMRKRLREASETIAALIEKVKQLEGRNTNSDLDTK